MYAQSLNEILKGRQTVDVYTELMNASNVFNFSHNTHQLYIQKSIQYFEKTLSNWSKARLSKIN